MGDFSKPAGVEWERHRTACNAFTLGFLSALRSEDGNLLLQTGRGTTTLEFALAVERFGSAP